MIDSSIFSRSTIFNIQDLPDQQEDTQTTIQKSILYHMIHSYIKMLFDDSTLSKQEKTQSAFQFGFQIAINFVQEESYGYVKYFIPKNEKQPKPFLPQMKLLNSRIWPSVFASSCKLFAIVSDTSASSYKLEDTDFEMTKYLSGGNNQKTREYVKLIHEFAKGTIWGFLDKMNLNAEINFVESSENRIAVEIKNITKKVKLECF